MKANTDDSEGAEDTVGNVETLGKEDNDIFNSDILALSIEVAGYCFFLMLWILEGADMNE